MLGNLGLAALLEDRPAEVVGTSGRRCRSNASSGTRRARSTGWRDRRRAGGGHRARDAALLLGAATQPARASAVELEPLELEVHDRVTEPLREALGAERFAVAHAAGAAPGHDDAVERALALSAPIAR